jgi:hypothetical protein
MNRYNNNNANNNGDGREEEEKKNAAEPSKSTHQGNPDSDKDWNPSKSTGNDENGEGVRPE